MQLAPGVAVGASPAGEVLADHRVEVEVGHALVARAARVEQQGVDRCVEAVGLGERQIGLGPARLRVVDLGDLLQAQAQCGQRRAQLMRHVARELPLARDRLGDPLGAGVEGLGDDVDLRDPEAPGARREVALPEPPRRPGHGVQRAHEATGLQRGERGRREHAAGPQRRDQQPHVAHALVDLRARLGGGDPRALRGPGTLGEDVAVQAGARDRAPAVGRRDDDGVAVTHEVRDVRRSDALPALDAVVDRGRDGVGLALEPRRGVGARAARLHDAERHAQDQHGGERDRAGREDQAPAHVALSARSGSRRRES